MIRHRFRRRLTVEEMDSLATLARKDTVACFVALWDIILDEAEGTDWNAATAGGKRFDVSLYAIPRDQESQLKTWMCHRQPRHRRYQIAMAFLDIGPATYEE